MRSFEVIKSEVNRLGCRLQPTQHGAALIQGDSACFPGVPGVVVAKVNRFGLVGMSFKERVHGIANLIESPLRNHKALLAAKLNQVRLDDEPHNPPGLVFAVSVVNACDQLAKRQRLLLMVDFHDMSIGRETAWALWGVTLPGISGSQPWRAGWDD
jgi:hypothetical protein